MGLQAPRQSLFVLFLRAVAGVAIVATFFPGLVFGQEFSPDFSGFDSFGGSSDEVTIDAEFTPAEDGRPAMLFVTANVADGYHVYAVDQGKLPDGGGGPSPTEIVVDETDSVRIAGEPQPIQPPEVHIDDLAWVGLALREHYGKVTWYIPLEIAEDADLANLTINGRVDTQACKEACIPFNIDFVARLGKGHPIPQVGQAADTASAETAETFSLWAVLGSGLLGGLILNLMPCVLPVIGLKVLSFAKQGGESRARILGLNLAYAAGLLSVFLVLATLAALVKLGLSDQSFGWGELYTLTWFKVAMTALVFAMALSFLGVWELPIPGFATTGTATELAAKEGPVGAFCMGVITTILATPCSGPFLGPVFGYTISQPPEMIYLIFASVGVGMALPYLLIGLFPSLISGLPKPGAWMDTFKNLMGFVLLGTVVYLFSTINQDYFIATLALMMGIWFACWLIGRVPLTASEGSRQAAWLGGAATAALVGWLSFTVLTPSESVLPWQPFTPATLTAARAQGKTVMVDFTADWCPTCKTNLKFAINREDVKKLVEENDVVTLLADWTDRDDQIKQALAEHNSLSIPLMAIYPAEPGRKPIVLRDLLTKQQVLDALAEAGPSLEATSSQDAGDTVSTAGQVKASARGIR